MSIEFEAARVAAAFGVKAWEAVGVPIGNHLRWTGKNEDGTIVKFYYWTKGDKPRMIALSDSSSRDFFWNEEDGHCWPNNRSLGPLMAQGLYRLDIQEEAPFRTLPELSQHEKVEIRLTFPREFWPQTWLKELESVPA